jgi:hypothetical protein
VVIYPNTVGDTQLLPVKVAYSKNVDASTPQVYGKYKDLL